MAHIFRPATIETRVSGQTEPGVGNSLPWCRKLVSKVQETRHHGTGNLSPRYRRFVTMVPEARFHGIWDSSLWYRKLVHHGTESSSPWYRKLVSMAPETRYWSVELAWILANNANPIILLDGPLETGSTSWKNWRRNALQCTCYPVFSKM